VKCFSALVPNDCNDEITNKNIKLLHNRTDSPDISHMLPNELHPLLSMKFLFKGDEILLCHIMVVTLKTLILTVYHPRERAAYL